MYVDLQLGAQGSSSLYLNTQKTTQFGLRLTEVKTNKDLEIISTLLRNITFGPATLHLYSLAYFKHFSTF